MRQKKPLKIAFTSTYSYPGISGVWMRVESLATELIKRGYEVHAFTTNIHSQTKKQLPEYELYKGIHIHRYKVKYKISDNAYFWDYKKFKKDLVKIKPDIIDCQTYRHPESNFVLKLNKKLKAKIFLTTHAPFLEKKLRKWKLNLAVKLYDLLFSKLNKFHRIIVITKWEIPYLLRLGCKKENIALIPNPIPEQFLNLRTKKGRNILFLGRISPIKDLGTLIRAFKQVKENKKTNRKTKNLRLKIVGPIEEPYGAKIIRLLKKLNLNNKHDKSVQFIPPVYNLKDKIREIDSCEIFVLPSKREGLPISLIEAMAREKIVISSTTNGGKEIIKNNKNGFLFEIGNYRQLAKIVNKIMNMSEKEKKKIRREARKTAKNFKTKKIVDDLEKIYLS